MKKRYLVIVILQSDGSTRVEVYTVSAKATADSVTYHRNTVCFFFINSEKTQEELMQEFVNICLMDKSYTVIGKELAMAQTYFIPEENLHFLAGATISFTNVKMSVEELIQQGFFEII